MKHYSDAYYATVYEFWQSWPHAMPFPTVPDDTQFVEYDNEWYRLH